MPFAEPAKFQPLDRSIVGGMEEIGGTRVEEIPFAGIIPLVGCFSAGNNVKVERIALVIRNGTRSRRWKLISRNRWIRVLGGNIFSPSGEYEGRYSNSGEIKRGDAAWKTNFERVR